MIKMAATLLAVAALSGCMTHGQASKTFSVVEVFNQRHELVGQRINVAGTLSHCQRLSCGLSADDGFYLSIGRSDGFDQIASRYEGKHVVIAATFTGGCISDPRENVIAMCADRSNTLGEPKLIGLARFSRS